MSLLRITTSPRSLVCRSAGITVQRLAVSTTSQSGVEKNSTKPVNSEKSSKTIEKAKQSHKSIAQADEDMRSIMEGLSGDGGAAGAELEDGKPVAMKRGVRENMFRYI